MPERVAKWLLIALATLMLPGCSLGYYLHSARGQASLMSKRTSIADVVVDPATPPALRERLLQVQRARAFASQQLGLPDKKGYRSYVDLGRPFAVWNVVATPEFSLQPLQWCFPVAGCVSYRGYFEEKLAVSFASKLTKKGNDVAVRGVSAYSTLGYFDDPVLNTMMHWDDAQLIAIIFHELAHQLFYIKGDTPFNESFATVVEEEGMRRWMVFTENGNGLASYERRRREAQCFRALVAAARERLQELYESGGELNAMRMAKARLFAELLEDYRRAEHRGVISDGYTAWFEQPLNNAHLASVGVYQQWVPALRALLVRKGGDLKSFYQAADALAELSAGKRANALQALGPSDSIETCRDSPD